MSTLLTVLPDGQLQPPWNVTWNVPNRTPLQGTATHVKGNKIKKYFVNFKVGKRWVKETQLEF